MVKEGKILIGKSKEKDIFLYPQMANRHGMVCGATGTGKTVTLKVLAESFSDLGVPVFFADVKGDLAGTCLKGIENENVTGRVESMGLAADGFDYSKYPVNFWDVYGEKGLPLRTTITEMGPLLLSRIMGLNDLQSDILNIIFQIADKEGLLLIDTKDLKAMCQYVSENAKEYSEQYGNMAPVSLNAIMRGVSAMESEGADLFFGEPALNISDWMTTDENGKGFIQILDVQKLILHPRMYSIFLLWLMSELFEELPEVGDCEKPKMVFFFDEAHMLFESANSVLLEKIEQMVKLIRSKGVGIYFVTQNPRDIPDGVLAQLGNKIEHALHAYTPMEQKAVKAAAMAFRANSEFDTYDTIQELGTGKALVSVLDTEGIPTIVELTKICPPQSSMGTVEDGERNEVINNSLLYDKYTEAVDRDSAFEFIQRRKLDMAEKEEQAQAEAEAEKEEMNATKKLQKELEAKKKAKNTAVKNVAKTTAGTIGREIGKSVGSIGGKFGKTLGGNIGATLGRNIMGTLFK